MPVTYDEHVLVLSRDDSAPARARESTRAWLATAPGTSAAAGDVELVASELVARAVHASTGGRLSLGLRLGAGVVRVEVVDEAAVPAQQVVPDVVGPVLLVEALATGWGVLPEGTGSLTWAEVPLVPQLG